MPRLHPGWRGSWPSRADCAPGLMRFGLLKNPNITRGGHASLWPLLSVMVDVEIKIECLLSHSQRWMEVWGVPDPNYGLNSGSWLVYGALLHHAT